MSLIERATKNHLSFRSPYGYNPSESAGIAFLVVFLLILIVHLGLALRYKYWIIFATLVPGICLEVLGWGGRLWSAYHVLKVTPFLMQISTLIIAPAFFSGYIYTILGLCIARLGESYSLLHSKAYLAIFVTADVVSLVIQAVGGGGAAVAAQNGTSTKKSTKIMLAGILFQLCTMTIFTVLAVDFIVRVILRRPYSHRAKRIDARTGSGSGSGPGSPTTSAISASGSASEPKAPNDPTPGVDAYKPNTAAAPNALTDGAAHDDLHGASSAGTRTSDVRGVEKLLAGVAFASLMIFIRGIYRSIELAQGWTGYLITHEKYFIWLDGFVMVLCVASFAVTHPGFLLPRRAGWKRA